MAIEFTDWASDILNRAQEAATRFNPDAKIRLAVTDTGVQALLADEPEQGDTPVQCRDMTLHVETGLDGLVDCEEPHDRLVLRPHGSAPNQHGEH